MLKILYPSIEKKEFTKKEKLVNIYDKIIEPIDNLYSYDLSHENLILNINIKTIKNYVKKGKIIPHRESFFNAIKYYYKLQQINAINSILKEKYQNKFSLNNSIIGKNIIKLEDFYFDLEKQSISNKVEPKKISGGIYLDKYQYGRYKRDKKFEELFLIEDKNIKNNKNLSTKKCNLICITNSRLNIWKEILKNKNAIFITNLVNYKKLNYIDVLKYDYVVLNISLLNNQYYKSKFFDYRIENEITQLSLQNLKQDLLRNENILWEKEPIFNLFCWNNFVIDFCFDELKKNFNENMLCFKNQQKWLIFNNYQNNYSNINSIFNIFEPGISPREMTNFIIKAEEFIPKIDINIKIDLLHFNKNEKEGYTNYLDDLGEIYKRQNLKFEDDQYLQKYCSFPQKQIKINKILKNLDNCDKLQNLNINYKKHIQQKLNTGDLECKICLDKISSDNIGLTDCGHLFCFSCIYKSIVYSKTCPTCRKNISMEETYFVTDNTKNIIVGTDILDELGTKNSNLLMNIKNYDKLLVISNFDDCILKIQNLLNQLNIKNLVTKNKKNLGDTKVYLSNYNEDFFNVSFEYKPDIIILVEPFYSKDFSIKIYDIYKSTQQKNFKFLILKESIEESFLKSSRINTICS